MKSRKIFSKILGVLFKVNIFRRMYRFIYRYTIKIINRIRKDIRLELMAIFALCFLLASIALSISKDSFISRNSQAVITYDDSINSMSEHAMEIANRFNQNKFTIKDKNKINEIMQNIYDNEKFIIIDLNGNILYKSQNVAENKIDLYVTMKNVMDFKMSQINPNEEFVSIYPIEFTDSRGYFILKGIPRGSIEYRNVNSNELLPIIIAIITFVVIFLLMTKRKVVYIHKISEGVIEISKGDLDYRIQKEGKDELAFLSNNINNMAEELKNKIEKERKIEKVKNELITNVSHDLRTPLTSIMGYLGLIKEKKYENEEQLNKYIDISFNKSKKLKVLMEDLFEYTKVSNGEIKLNKREIYLKELLEQLIEEFIPIFEENNLQLEQDMIDEKIKLYLDGDKIARVFENLIMNALRYSFKPGKISINLYKEQESIVVSVKNKGKPIPKEDIDHLFDRFYKADKSRTQNSSGSGLGLAIAKNIVELHGGDIWAECKGENITFFVKFKIYNL